MNKYLKYQTLNTTNIMDKIKTVETEYFTQVQTYRNGKFISVQTIYKEPYPTGKIILVGK